MPPFGHLLNDTEVAQVVSYLRSGVIMRRRSTARCEPLPRVPLD
jgi:mono/diheme cytochrome c family protein